MSVINGGPNSRGSTPIGGAGLFVLGLGALVLLAGLSNPAPAMHDIAQGTVRVASERAPMLDWMGGLAMIGVALVVMVRPGVPWRISRTQPPRSEFPLPLVTRGEGATSRVQ